MAGKKTESFEKSIAELESLVATMEQGQLPLDTALKHFERGIKLARDCQTALSAAEKKIQLLTADDTLAPFTVDEIADEDEA